jgi:phospholipid/cholesterol/gamma-HCH transport system substrate-binding protein
VSEARRGGAWTESARRRSRGFGPAREGGASERRAERSGQGMTRWRAPLAVAAVAALAAVVALAVGAARVPTRRLVAHFTSAVGILPGNDVRVLGVHVGDVVAVRPQGTSVEVEMRYDARYPIPAGAQAVIIPPSVVSDRYVQLTPAYTGGPRLADGADLPTSRTAVPLELDDVYRALDQFNRALGPAGANKNGALSTLLATGRANLQGSGADLAGTLDGLAKNLGTLADGRDDLFGSVADLQKFVTALAASDQQVRLFNEQLAAVGEQLAGERDDLAATIRTLATALADITGFVSDNRAELKSNVDALTDISGVLVRQQQALITVLNIAPLALSNLHLAYNARSGTLDTRDDVLGPYDPASYVCSLLAGLVPTTQIPKECVALARLLDANHLPITDQLRKLLGLPPATSSPGGSTPGTPGSVGVAPSGPGVPGLSGGDGSVGTDPTLGGILGLLP